MSRPRKTTPSTAVSIVLLSSPVECIGILLEGGRKCPGDMLLVMSPTWLIKDKSEDKEGLHSLYLKEAITFDRCGCSYCNGSDFNLFTCAIGFAIIWFRCGYKQQLTELGFLHLTIESLYFTYAECIWERDWVNSIWVTIVALIGQISRHLVLKRVYQRGLWLLL